MRRFALLCAACAVLGVAPAPAQQPSQPRGPRRLILEPGAGTIFTVEGTFPRKPGVCEVRQPKPLRAKYRGRLDLRVDADGRIDIINHLTFPEYLRGLAEVPLSWPGAALRAQAIAARTYALFGMRRGERTSYDICATDRCQVYRGATVELGAFGERWVDAVESTRGRVLTYRGDVIQAFYFSTSSGRTRRSFPGGTSRPWLPSVDGEDDDAPLARWRARVRLPDLAGALRRAGSWPGGSITSVRQSGDRVTVSGPGGSRGISKDALRIAINLEAPCVSEKRYPGPGRDAGTRLPLTVPSSVYSVRTSGDVAIFDGRGWGHGVGMSQFGARSLADRGRTTAQILSHFYGPARITRVTEPGRIRVLAAEDMTRVRVRVEGSVRVRTETGSRLRPGDVFEATVVAGNLRIRRGIGPSLAPVLEVRPTIRRVELDPGEDLLLRFELSRSARVRARLTHASGDHRLPERSFERGPRTLRVPLRGADGRELGGEVQVVLEAYDGLDRVRSAPVAVVVREPPYLPAGPRDPTGRSRPWLLVLSALLAVAAVAVAVALRARTRRRDARPAA